MIHESLGELYLKDRGGDVGLYNRNLADGQRLGQAWFNALSMTDRQRLAGTSKDPFHKDFVAGAHAVHEAIEFLLDTEDVDIRSRREEK